MPDYEAMANEAIRLANEEGDRLRAEAAAGAEGGDARATAPDDQPASPDPERSDAELERAQGSAEEGTEPDTAQKDAAPPPAGTESQASIDARLREAGFSRSQRQAVRDLLDQTVKGASSAAVAEAIAAQKQADEAKAAYERQASEAASAVEKANAGLGKFLGTDQEFTDLQAKYDDDSITWDEKSRFLELRERRAMAGVIRQNVWGSFDRDLRASDEIEGVEKELWNGKARDLRDYTQRVAAGVAQATVRKRDAEWQAKEAAWRGEKEDFEGRIEELAAEATTLKTQLASKSAAVLDGGRPAASRSAVLQTLMSQAGSEADFIERAMRGDFSGVDLSG